MVLLENGADSSGNEATNKGLLPANENTSKFLARVGRPDQEKVALLALKYNVDPQLTEMLIDEYLSKVDISYTMMKSMAKRNNIASENNPSDIDTIMALDRTSFVNIVQQMAKAHSVDVKVLSGLLVDYREWSVAEKSNAGNRAH